MTEKPREKTLEIMLDWLDTKIELNNRLLSQNGEASDFENFLISDNRMMERIKDALNEGGRREVDMP